MLGYAAAFYFLFKQILLGVAYAIRSGLSTVGSVSVGALVRREFLGPNHLVGIGPFVAYVVTLNVLADGTDV